MISHVKKPLFLMSLLVLMLTTAVFYYISYNFSWSFKPPKPALKVQKNISDALLTKTAFISNDGYQHPLKIWRAKNGNHKAIVVCLHGFNDYSSSFTSLGKYLSTQDIKTIAYDQRGFGGTNSPGYWHGGSVMADDLFSLVALIKSQEQNMPIFVLGSSMGGGVVLKTLSSTLLDVNGVILVAPSVRGRTVMPWYQRATLWLAAHTIPWAQIGGGGLKITPSDNIAMLRDLRKDPLIIKKTIIATVWGLVNLMDDALLASNDLNANTLLLYGKKDEVIPPVAMKKMIDSLPVKRTHIQKIIYDEGYHMLLRDLQGWLVQSDINIWIQNALVVNSSRVVENQQIL
ncbi:MAG TPA: alpha/beta hydrolase [Methylococcaceae bacterium]|jgi:alpha-beta hydrolase superfamily lysophospholipase|nr:alpha/beta hydrolase [Methylococcaceae bacterium]HIB63036.1 alpha/beta hydrolase [Methylococcaceae bacterium]HIN67701.1 alpha/beta hydrolase [Methylococcales bacterium]